VNDSRTGAEPPSQATMVEPATGRSGSGTPIPTTAIAWRSNGSTLPRSRRELGDETAQGITNHPSTGRRPVSTQEAMS
jgi:hypothetical protein